MNREILFRGKDENWHWCEGSLIINEDGSYWIKDTDYNVNNGKCDLIPYKVKPETVGQFTGLLDKNGARIFEGDVDSDGFVFEFNTSMGGWFRVKNGEGFGWHEQCLNKSGIISPFEIIGNIHDNPELLK